MIKPGFKTAEPMELLHMFTAPIHLGHPSEMATIIMSYKLKTYLVPIEVARLICRRLSDVIAKAEEVNIYKAEYGQNPKQ